VHGDVGGLRPAREEPQRGRGVVRAVDRDDDRPERTATALYDEHGPWAMADDRKGDGAQERAFHAAESARADDDEVGVPLLGDADDLGTRIAVGDADLRPRTADAECGARVLGRRLSLRPLAVADAQYQNRRAVQHAGHRDPVAGLHRTGRSVTAE
jgi:hypothetical protein